MKFHRLIALILMFSALSLSGSAPSLAESVLVRLDFSSFSLISPDIRSGLSAVAELRDAWLVIMPEETALSLTGAGAKLAILDSQPAKKAYFLVRVRNAEDWSVLEDLGRTVRLDEATALFWSGDREAREILPAEFHMARIFPDAAIPLRAPAKPAALASALPAPAADPVIVQLVSLISQSRLTATISDLQNFLTRYVSTPSCEAAGAYLYEAFRGLGLQTEYDPFTFSNGHYSARNIVATLRGQTVPGREVIVCAHYDSYSNKPSTLAPGADDNGSGTAAVLEIARVLAGASFDYTIKFVCFSAEEWGLYGSQHYATAARAVGEDIIGVLNMDMIAYPDRSPWVLDAVCNGPSATLASRYTAAASEYAGLTIKTVSVSSWPYSDQSPFWNAGYAGLCAIENEEPGNPYYHKTTDTLSTLTMEYALKAVKASLATAAGLAGPLTGGVDVPIIGVSKISFNFGTERNGTPTRAATSVITNTGTGTLNWTATPSANWISISPGSGTGSGVLTIGIARNDMSPGSYDGTITITAPNATNSPQTINVKLNIVPAGTSAVPFGAFDTPVNGSSVSSSIAVTGWALDDTETTNVKIYRDPVGLEPAGQRIYIGDAVFVEGSRPDVEIAYPTYPLNFRAGWGYMLLTNFLPNGGNGTFTLYATATDREGHVVVLNHKMITCDNLHAVKPFGALDTPGQGEEILGSLYYNFGWALTPLPNMIPTDGSTIGVWVDGLPLAHPSYNHYRDDIATLFPGYANSNAAVGVYELNTTAFANGVHTIAWSVVDNAGNEDGIGSRYFSILNTGNPAPQSELPVLTLNAASSPGPFTMVKDLDGFRDVSKNPIHARKGYDRIQPPFTVIPTLPVIPSLTVIPRLDEGPLLQIRELERVEILLDDHALKVDADRRTEKRAGLTSVSTGVPRYEGYLIVEDELRSLPIGSALDARTGIFTWLPGPGFLGDYRLVFVDRENKSQSFLTIRIEPRYSKIEK